MIEFTPIEWFFIAYVIVSTFWHIITSSRISDLETKLRVERNKLNRTLRRR